MRLAGFYADVGWGSKIDGVAIDIDIVKKEVITSDAVGIVGVTK